MHLSDDTPTIWALPKVFLLAFNNEKLKPFDAELQVAYAEGVCFSSGRVVLDAEWARCEYRSMEEMQAAFAILGHFSIEYFDESDGGEEIYE